MKKLLIYLSLFCFPLISFSQGGCTDSTACNYDSTATEDDGSCCFDNCIHIGLSDAFNASDITWDIVDEDGNIVASGGVPFDETLCIPAGCYTTNIYDGNGEDLNVITVYLEDEDGNVLVDVEIPLALGMDLSFPWCITDLCAGPDFNCDFYIDAADLLVLLSNFGCMDGCVADMNGDNMVTTIDILLFLEEY